MDNTLRDNLDCKTVRIFARAVKQKVWNEAENRERDWGLLLHALPIFEKKTDCFAVYP